MNKAIMFKAIDTGSVGRARSAARIPLTLLPFAVLASACGGGGGGGDGSNAMSPILQVGMQRQYTGTATRAVVYASPTATEQNNTLQYSFTENVNVEQAPAGAPGDFDVQSDYTYTIVQDPGVGTVPTSQTVDTYESLVTSGDTQMVTTLGQKVVAVSNDETANALGDGPYTQTTTTTSTYPSPRDNFSYPLQTGATMTVPQSQTQTIAFTDVNAGGAAPSNGSDVGYSISRTENDDGSFSYQTTYVNGNGFTRTQNSDGSGSQTFTNASAPSTTMTTLGLPVTANGVTTIPVTVTLTGTTTTTTDHAAADWYPNGGSPSSPLVLSTRNVVGPTSSLPTECNGAVLKPGIYEIDTTTNSLSPIGSSNTVTMTRNFSAADGASVCQLSTATESSYNLDTGALVSTTTTTTTTLLSAINY